MIPIITVSNNFICKFHARDLFLNNKCWKLFQMRVDLLRSTQDELRVFLKTTIKKSMKLGISKNELAWLRESYVIYF